MSEIDPRLELHIRNKHDQFREESDRKYAQKIVERIVFGFITLLLIAAATAWISLIFIKT